MNLSYYKQILTISPEKPDISSLKVGNSVNETWPLILKSIINISKTQAIFEVSDSISSIICKMDSLKMVRKLSLIEPGQIIFLYDSKIYGIDNAGNLDAEVYLFYTLKEVNDGVPQTQKHNRKVRSAELSNKSESTTSITNKVQTSEESDSRWRTLDERWKNQGRLDN